MSRNKPSLARLIAIASVLVLAVAGAGWWLFQDAGQRRITAYFAAAVGLYPKGDVRILGVPVGTIEEVVPSGKLVRVEMTVDREVRVPADAVAVAVSRWLLVVGRVRTKTAPRRLPVWAGMTNSEPPSCSVSRLAT